MATTPNNSTTCKVTEQSTDQPVAKAPTTIESLIPSADANQLLDLIAQGHNPADLHALINQTKQVA